VASAISTIVTRRIARIALNENASRLEQNAAASPFPCVKKDSPLALTKLQRVDSRGGGLSTILYYVSRGGTRNGILNKAGEILPES